MLDRQRQQKGLVARSAYEAGGRWLSTEQGRPVDTPAHWVVAIKNLPCTLLLFTFLYFQIFGTKLKIVLSIEQTYLYLKSF